MDKFLQGLREGSAGQLGPHSIAQAPNIPLLNQVAQQPEDIDSGTQGILAGLLQPTQSQQEQQQQEAALPTPQQGTMGPPAPSDLFTQPEFIMEAHGPIQGPLAPGVEAPSYETVVDTSDPSTTSWHNFPDRPITVDEVTPHIIWALEGEGIHQHQNLTNYVFGVLYVPVAGEDGEQARDDDGNLLWVKNDTPMDQWTPEMLEQRQMAEWEMEKLNNNIEGMNYKARMSDGDYGADGIPGQDDPMGKVGGAVISEVAHQLGRPLEWSQNEGADAWVRKEIFGEDLSAWEETKLRGMQVTSAGGNVVGSGAAWITPKTENPDLQDSWGGFVAWAKRQDPGFIERIYNEGWDPDGDGENIIYGGNAVWDVYAHTRTGMQRMGIDTAMDPFSWIPVGGGAVRGVGSAMKLSKIGPVSTAGKWIDRAGKFAISTDDGLGTVFMTPLKIPASGVRYGLGRIPPVGRFFDDIDVGWNTGRWNSSVNKQEFELRAQSDPDVVEQFGRSWAPDDGSVPFGNARRHTFEEDVLKNADGEFPDTYVPDGNNYSINTSPFRRTEKFFYDLSMFANRRVRRRDSGFMASRAADAQFGMEYQAGPERGAGYQDSLFQRGRSARDVLDREPNTILRQNNNREQLKAHRKMVESGYHPLIQPSRSRKIGSDALRREWADVHDTIDPGDLAGRQQMAIQPVLEIDKQLGAKKMADFSEPIEETFESLGYLAPDHSRGERDLRPRQIDNIDTFLESQNAYARQGFFQEYRNVVEEFRARDLIAGQQSGWVSPEQAAYSRAAILIAWKRSFKDQWLENKMPKWEFKDAYPNTPQAERNRAGNFSVNSAFEAIVHGSEREAQQGFLYLHNLEGYQSWAKDAEALRSMFNQIHEETGLSGSWVFRNSESDAYFTHKNPTRNWDPSKGMKEDTGYTGYENIRQSNADPIQGPMRAGVGPSRGNPFGTPNGDMPTISPTASPWVENMPVPQRRALAVPNEPIRLQVVRNLRADGTDQRVRNINKAIENNEPIPHTIPEPEPFDPEPHIIDVPDDTPPVHEPSRVETFTEMSKNPNSRVYDVPELDPETVADANQRIAIMRASGMVEEAEYEYWRTQTGNNPVLMFKHLSMKAQRGAPHMEADGIFDLNTPLAHLPKGGVNIRKPQYEWAEEIRTVLDQAHRNDNLDLSDKVIAAIEEDVFGKDLLGGLTVPELSAPEYVRVKFGRQLRSLENIDTIASKARAVDPREAAVRDLAVRTMHTVTSGRDWPVSLSRTLEAVGFSVSRDLQGSAKFGYNYNVDNAINRLTTLTRHVVAGHYLSKGVRPDEVARLLRNSLPEIDKFAEDFLRISSDRHLRRVGARNYLDDLGLLKHVHIENRGGKNLVIANIPDVNGEVFRSYEALAQTVMRSRGESTGHVDFNSVSEAMGADHLMRSGDPDPGWRGQDKVEAPATDSIGEDPYSWDGNRLRAESHSAAETIHQHNRDYASWSITRMSKEDFLDQSGPEFHLRVNEELGNPLNATPKQREAAMEKVYDRAYETSAHYENYQRLLERVADNKYANGDISVEQLRGIKNQRAEDPRGIPADRRTHMQERQARMLDVSEEVQNRRLADQQRDEDWIAYHESVGETEQANRRRREMQNRRKADNFNVIEDGRGYVRLTGRQVQNPREINRQIRLAQATRERWAGVESLTGSHFLPEEDAQVKLLLGELVAIRKSLPTMNELYRLDDEYTDLLERAPRAPGRKGPDSRFMGKKERARLNKERDSLRKTITEIERESGIAHRWVELQSYLFQADERLKLRIKNAIRAEEESLKSQEQWIRKTLKTKTARNNAIDELHNEYYGRLLNPNAKKGKVRDGTGILSTLEAEHLAIEIDQGMGPIPKKGKRSDNPQKRAYRGFRLQIGRMANDDELYPVQADLWFADAAAGEAKLDPKRQRRDIARKVRMGIDLDQDEELIFQGMAAERAQYETPGDTRLVRSPSQYLMADGTDEALELLPTEGGNIFDPEVDAIEIHNFQAEEFKAGRRPNEPESVEDIALMLEQEAMEAEGYTWIAPNVYVPRSHPVIRDGVIEGTGDSLSIVYRGDVYTDEFDLFDTFSELEDLSVRNISHLQRIRGETGDGPQLLSIERAKSEHGLEPSQIDKAFADSASDADMQIYMDFEDVRSMTPEEQYEHVRSRIQTLINDGDEEAVKVFQDKLVDVAVSEYSMMPGQIDHILSPVDDAALRAIYRTMVDDLGVENIYDIQAEDIFKALGHTKFRDALTDGLNPELRLPVDKIEGAKNIHGGWFDKNLDSQSRYRKAMAETKAGETVELAAEEPSAATHGVRPNRRGTGRVAQFQSRRVHEGWLPEKKGAVTENDVDSARSTLDMLETFSPTNQHGIIFHSPWYWKKWAQDSAEISENIIRKDIIDKGEDRFRLETKAAQDAADDTRRKAAYERTDPRTGEVETSLKPNEYREVRPVDLQDRYILDNETQTGANMTFRGEGYYKGYTYFEGYQSLQRKNLTQANRYVELENKRALHGNLSREEEMELDKIKNRFDKYGEILTVNKGIGETRAVPRGVASATTREGPVVDMVRDTRKYVLNERFPADLLARKELEDLIFRDGLADYVAPRWANFLEKYSNLIGSWSKWKLLNPLNIMRFTGLNAIGDYGQMLMMGHGDAVAYSLKKMGSREMKALWREAGTNPLGETLDTEMGKLLYNAGMGPNVNRIRGSLSQHMSRHVDTSLREFNKYGQAEALLKNQNKKWSGYSEFAQALTTSLEWNRRNALFFTDFQTRMIRHHNDLSLEALKRAQTMGLEDLTARDLQIMIKDLGYGTSASDLYNRMVSMAGVSKADTATVKKWADRVSRDWANTQRKAMNASVGRVNKVLFSYEMNDIDEVIRLFMPFHFWATRALPLYSEIALRNPYLVSAYIRATEGMDKMHERGEVPAFMSNVVEFWMSPAGYSAFTNPLSAIGMVSLFADGAKSAGVDNETFLGTMLRIAGDYGGINLYPWFRSALNMSGQLGDTNAGLDPTGFSRERRVLGSTVQVLVSSGVFPGIERELLSKPFEQRLREGREILTGILPGVETIEAKDANASNEVSFQYLMENEIRERDGMSPDQPLTVSQQEEIVLAWNDPDDPLYKEALVTYSRGNFVNNIYNSVIPFYLNIQPEGSSYLDKQAKSDQPLPQGVPLPPGGRAPGDGYNTTGYTEQEQAWLDSWRRATGEDYKEGDLDQWKRDTELRSDLLWLDPKAQELVIHEYKFDNLGTTEQQEMRDTYYQIVFGNLPSHGTLTVSPDKVIGYHDVNNMSPQERSRLADEWIAGDEKREEQWLELMDLEKSYRAANPAYGEYMTWRWSINNYESRGAYRKAVSAENENAARYFNEQRKELVARYGNDVDKINEQMDIRTNSMEAYFAIHGHKYNRTDPEPLSTFESGFDPIESPRESGGSPGMLGQANKYLTDMYGTMVRLETMPSRLREPLIELLPPEMQDVVRSELRN